MTTMTDHSSDWWGRLYGGAGVPVGDRGQLLDVIADRVTSPSPLAADRALLREFIEAHVLAAIRAGEDGDFDDTVGEPGEEQDRRAIDAIVNIVGSPLWLPEFLLPLIERVDPEVANAVRPVPSKAFRDLAPLGRPIAAFIWTLLRRGSASSASPGPRGDCAWCGHPGSHGVSCAERRGYPRRCGDCSICETEGIAAFREGLALAAAEGNLLVEVDRVMPAFREMIRIESVSFVNVFPNLNRRKEHLLITSEATLQFAPSTFGVKLHSRTQHALVTLVYSRRTVRSDTVGQSVIIEQERSQTEFHFGTFSTAVADEPMRALADHNAELAVSQIESAVRAST